MSNPVKIKRSNVPGKLPTTATLQDGEIAMNTADGKMFFSTGAAIKTLANAEDLAVKQPINALLTSVSGLTGSKGLLVDNNGVASTATITGVANQTVVTNGDGTAGNPMVGLAADANLPGTGGVNVPAGPTASRKAGDDGAIRYNTSLACLEGLISGSWETILTGLADLAAAQIRRTKTLALTTTANEISFDTVDLANDTSVIARNAITSRMDVKMGGLYLVIFECESINTTNANLDLFQIRRNGTAVPNGLATINCRSTRQHVSKAIPIQLSANDYITVAASSNTGTTGTMQIGATLTVMRMQGLRGPAGPAGGSTSLYYTAATLDNPNSVNWAVNALAPVSADTTNAALNIRAFDATAEEGVGCTIYIPPFASNLTFTFTAKAATAPATARAVVLNLYRRLIAMNAAVGAWGTAVPLNTLSIGANAFFQTYTQTFSLASLGMVAGETYQLEITRKGASATDTLVGDLHLLQMSIAFA